MQARAQLVVGRDDRGHSVPTTLFGEAPLLMRVTGSTASGLTVHLVGGAAGPLGGDCLTTDVQVGDGATLQLRSVAASLAQPSTAGGGSMAHVTASVGSGADLDWRPEPLVSVRDSDHTQRTTVGIADASSSVCWVDEVVLGRHDERSGRLTVHQRFTVAGRPLVHHTISFDPEHRRRGRHGTGRAVITVVVGGPGYRVHEAGPAAVVRPDRRAARLRLDGSYTMLTALADDLDGARLGLAELGFGHV